MYIGTLTLGVKITQRITYKYNQEKTDTMFNVENFCR